MIFHKTLTNWYSINKRELPWRKTNNPYYIWLSEIILQQTKIKQGLPYFERFIKKYPTVFDLSKANESDVLKLWQGLGYYSRARNLHATSKYIANDLKGVFPNNYKTLLKLKGVGDYTASAIASFAYNEVTAVVDGNVYRLLSRYFGIYTPINTTEGIKTFKNLAQELIDKKNPAEFNQAIMEFGALQCKPKNPDCSSCPFANTCMAFNTNSIIELPVKIKSAKAKNKYFNFLVFISKNKKTILEKRIGKGIWQNLYQFPLIETNTNEPITVFKHKVKLHGLLKNKDFKITLYNKTPILHKLSHQHLNTNFWIITLDELPVKGIKTSKIQELAVPILIGNFINSFNFNLD